MEDLMREKTKRQVSLERLLPGPPPSRKPAANCFLIEFGGGAGARKEPRGGPRRSARIRNCPRLLGSAAGETGSDPVAKEEAKARGT